MTTGTLTILITLACLILVLVYGLFLGVKGIDKDSDETLHQNTPDHDRE